MKRIAVYGKGGIGKSTISANLSAALAHAGRSVLQIGCDPKHDSTKLLLGGQSITCVLDYLRDALPGDYDLSQVLRTGYAGVGCVEAGGPKPGVGCAGRGIISAFEMLEQFRLEDHYDTVVYDVLGDVVCGGFAVPIRREYADTIFIVTSGEFMALYAANNILRGIRTFDGEQGARVAGIVYNQRNIADEEERVARFAQAVGLPVFARVPRSDSFAFAEQANQTVVEQAHDKALVDLFASMAQRLIAGPPLHVARPLSDEELEAAVFGVPDAGGPSAGTGSLASDGGERTLQDLDASSGAPAADAQDTARREVDLTDPNRYLSKTVARGEPLHGCAFNGAVATALHLTDAVVLAHAPTSCANLSLQAFTAAGRRSLFERGTLLPASLAPNLECTNMGETEVVFGGTGKLVETVGRLKQRGPRAIVVVSSCPAGIIGDDIDQVADLADEACPILPLKTDGNMSGDYLQGQLTASLAIARTFVAKADPQPNTASIFAEKMVVTNTQSNYELVAGFLERMGVQVQCRFLHQATVDEVAAFGTSQLCLPAYTDYAAQLLGKLFSEEFGLTVFDRGFPIGYDETVDWLRAVGDFYGKRDIAEQIVAEQAAAYEEAIGALSKRLAGKKLMVVAYNCELDWILKTALDAGMQIVRIGILDYSQDVGFRTRLGIDLPVVQGYAREDRAREIIELAPDVLLTNYSSAVADSVAVADTIPMCPDVGFMSGVVLARRWARLMDMPAQGSWKNDAALFGQGALPRNGRAQGSGGGRA